MAKQKPEGDLVAYLKEHLKYERDMLRFTYGMLFQTEDLGWCAMFESFGIHARNLYDFLRHEGSATNTVRADDYVPGRKKPSASNGDGKLNGSFFHLSTSRLANKPVSLTDAIAIGGWIDKEWAAWTEQLREPFKALVDAYPACPAPTSGIVARSPSATNHITTTSSTVVFGGSEQRGG
ncbi:hypothetical protein [Altererythrobacter lauratis]|uniref:Uncharacterized protein n=1 Tax=Alteraurantiacibacter lauratis TaxID=2054627 RepID=A0ABV7EDG8_9SPHN